MLLTFSSTFHLLFRHTCSTLSAFDINLHTTIPSYISDHQSLFFLASAAVDQNEALVVFGLAHPLVPYSDDKDDNSDDVEILEGPMVIPTSHKTRARKMKEALEDKFLHCSKRLNHDLQGFRDAASKE